MSGGKLGSVEAPAVFVISLKNTFWRILLLIKAIIRIILSHLRDWRVLMK